MRELGKVQAEINRLAKLIDKRSSKDFLNCQQQLNALRKKTRAIKSEDLKTLQENVRQLSYKVWGLNEFIPPQNFTANRSRADLFAPNSSTTSSGSPALASQANLQLPLP